MLTGACKAREQDREARGKKKKKKQEEEAGTGQMGWRGEVQTGRRKCGEVEEGRRPEGATPPPL